MKKKLNSEAIANELRGNSAFFPNYAKEETDSPTPSEPQTKEKVLENKEQSVRPIERTDVPVNEPITAGYSQEKVSENNDINSTTPARTPVRRVKRTITRYAFEFYQDQIETLRQLSLNEKLLGEKGSMSEMVRVAIDEYIKKLPSR